MPASTRDGRGWKARIAVISSASISSRSPSVHALDKWAGRPLVRTLPTAVTEPLRQYLEDFEVGDTFHSPTLRIQADDIKRFASEFDPQPFHLDEEIARDTIFGGLAASGWHTAALTMKLVLQSGFTPAGGLVGVGFEGRWPK